MKVRRKKCFGSLTFRILHLLVSQLASSHGWNIPRVTQFRIITVIVSRSNHLKEKREGERKISVNCFMGFRVAVTLILDRNRKTQRNQLFG